ncbi:hypothetical protein BG08_1040 [Bacillus thuringiensis serovar kurstaki]|uniref:Uncharacterized protein n=2 Tax=Bacillus cereus TaxID=1396 RepID=A0A9W5QBR5_BACCE|nr:hypothetical protein BG08_1040 [Bacillus thuringiensis serovar kurstaki]EHL77793.1 hypothetical protein HMPREF1014_00093 [Bacillus sp. 7_6_55CFAA_CT2]EJQ17746.1 hypothetical protein IE5_04602 [Bacillus cereus BAG3X2-2]EJV92099.1 hypothetical protein IG1_00102 [Bacillus cereus HD73]EOO33479.1 hypothetical protein IIU_03025 [Bacillus cereus VD133]EOP17546.1 hypothetical protein IGG_01294 [Bacillus cereus HuB13-1]EOP57271.1 hypothetical protein IGU_02314 [Bacillus cereus ISP2954]EOP99403.1 h
MYHLIALVATADATAVLTETPELWYFPLNQRIAE